MFGFVQIGVVITDGQSQRQRRRRTRRQARKAKADNIWLFTIGVGNNVDKWALKDIASKPPNKFRHLVASGGELLTLAEDLAISTCNLNASQADSAGGCQ